MFLSAFPVTLYADVQAVLEVIPCETFGNFGDRVSSWTMDYNLGSEKITVPYRLYCLEISDGEIQKLNCRQEMILHCIYSRSCNGFIREKHIRKLLLMEYEGWAFPFILKVCDEYVIEFLEMIYALLKVRDNTLLKQFCYANRQSFCKSYQRMISYWNCFYRDKCNCFYNYIGKILFEECFGYSRSLERFFREENGSDRNTCENRGRP
jgi:hypothetical protein